MPTISEFLEARIAEDEAEALAANAWASHGGPTQWIGQPGDRLVVRLGAGGPHIARHSPARVLAECAAKRAIVTDWLCENRMRAAMDRHNTNPAIYYGQTSDKALRHLAAVYKDHPDYDSVWAL